MMTARWPRLAALLLAALLSACSQAAGPAGKIVLNRGLGPDIKSLDPAYIDSLWEGWVVGDMLMGLTTEGPDGKPIPGAATHWEVSADGLTWTFHLRDHNWSDGVPVTAADFVAAWQREMDPATGAVYSYILWPLKNARAVSDGRLPPSALGVRAIDGKTLEVRLEHPAPFLPELMTEQAAYPIPLHLFKTLGADFSKPKNFVGNGPYIVKEWVPLDHLTLVKNPRFYDAAHVQIDTVNYFVTEDTEAALKRYRAGELDTVYAYPALEIDWLRHHIPNDIKTVPFLATEYLAINFKAPLFQDKRMREVVNLAYDRHRLVADIRRVGEPAAYAFVPPGVAHYQHTAHMALRDMPFDVRLARARQLMQAMGYSAQHHLNLDLLTDTNPDSVRTAAVMQGMMAQVYIDVNIIAEERQAAIVDLEKGDFTIARTGWAADFNDPSNFLTLYRCGAQQNFGRYCNPAYDALMTKADATRVPAERRQLMARAEQMLLDDYALVPVFYNVTRDLAKPYVKGWIANPIDVNRTRWLRIEGKP